VWFCALGACRWGAAVGLRAHGEDQFWGDGGADRVVVSAGSRSIEHLGLAHDEAGLAALKAAAAERLAAGQAELDLGVAGRPGSEPLPITASRACAPVGGAMPRL
jgi:hypothetical protein